MHETRKEYDLETIDHAYRSRVKLGVVVVQIAVILLFRFWPDVWMGPEPMEVPFNDREIISIDPTYITVQAPAPPAPLKPFVPISPLLDPVIDYVDELELDIEPISLVPLTEGIAQRSGEGDTGTETGESRIAQSPSRPPGVVRIVEPVIPEAARRARVRAELTVRFLVAVDGSVERAEVVDIKLFNEKTEKFESASSIGHGLEEATLLAAQSWRFRPAQVGDERVRAWYNGLFTIGN